MHGVKREGHNLTKKENTQISRLLHSSVVMLVNSDIAVIATALPPEACILQVNDALYCIPKRHKITFTDFYIKCYLLVE